ncbi:hypothetical protein EUX98_g7550 [Antrodiella citrinella]|uniref:DUF1793-domain-containing protein n=1 Tax=Antrodiella citrinella TaxID=2447956 RepID=A0A4S4MLJ9_9APHY|nr:hypothetical protein EUX98_g7550 [Antrodiella citrinella]
MFSASSIVTAVALLGAGVVSTSPSWTTNPFNPAAIPLAVRSPYLSAWLPQGGGNALNTAWPTFWTGMIVGWAGYVSVDGNVFTFLGAPSVTATQAVQKSFQFTSTQSTFVMTAGPVDLTVNFLSPVEPADLVKQSFPFSYLSLSAASNDGSSHAVQVYTDISAEWVTGNVSLVANWTTTAGDNNLVTHQVQLATQEPFTELNDQIQHGSAFFSTGSTQGVTYQTGEDVQVRAQFVQSSVLLNSQDTQFRAVSDKWPVFAFASDLGSVSTSSTPVVFALGHVRDPAIQYITSDGPLQERSLYFWTQFSTIGDAIASFLGDYTNALARANAIDNQISTDARNVSLDYAELASLSLRQAFAGSEVTVSKNSDGSFNASDVLMFTKEISSSGSVSTVDMVYTIWPLYLYVNATLGKYALLPMLNYQASGQYPNAWSVHDLGSHYPEATGHNDGKDIAMPVEECGNMLIMVLSYTQRTGDNSLIVTYYDLLDKWAQFLVDNALHPSNQLSSDAFAGVLANQTNLAIKGIIGIRAMSEIANMTGNSTGSQQYASVATSYASQFQKLATSTDGKHLTLSYGNDSSWGLSYNLYADRMLGTNVFPASIYELQTSWYGNADTSSQFGLPLDTRNNFSLSQWEIWTAATVNDTTVRDSLVGGVLKLAADGKSSKPFGDWYDTLDGSVNSFAARPVVVGLTGLVSQRKRV